MALEILALVLIVSLIVWIVLQFVGPGELARFALIVWAACVTLLLLGARLEV